MDRRRALLSLVLVGAACAGDPADPSPCAGIDCSDHGTCAVAAAGVACVCDPGYHPVGTSTTCVVDDDDGDPCAGVACAGHGTCAVEDGVARCACDPGFESAGADCLDVAECADPALNDCDPHARCVDEPGTYTCTCDAAYYGDGARCTWRKKVLVLGVDGVRPDALAVADTPSFAALIAAGVFSDEGDTNDTTVSGPGWSSILNGVWRDKHGVTDNTFTGANYGAYPDLFTRIEAVAPSLNTVRISNWDGIYASMPTGADRDLAFDYATEDDVTSVAAAVDVLSDAVEDVDVLFLYFAMVDVAGHDHGFHPTVPEYVAAIELVDRQIGEVLATLAARPHYAEEEWLIVSTTDHGGTADGSHGRNIPEHRRIYMLVDAPGGAVGGIFPPPMQVDVVPTVLAHLGIPIDAAWGLDGRALQASATAPPAPALGVELLFNGDAERDRSLDELGFDGPLSGWLESGGGVAVAYGAAGFPAAGSVPEGGASFFAGGTDQASSLTQSFAVTGLALGSATYEVSALLGGYAEQNDSARLTLRFYDGAGCAAVDWGNGKVYFFRGADYIRYDVAANAADPGFPAPIAGAWPGMETFAGGAQDLDAAINWGNGKAYFFKGAEYVRYDLAADAVDANYPRPIADGWPGLELLPGGARDLDTVIDWGNGKVYLFQDGWYMRWDVASDLADPGYPRAVSAETWPGLQIWASGIDEAIRWDATTAFVFKEGSFVRYAIDTDRVAAGYPAPIDATTWPGLDPWYAARRSVTLGPVTAGDRGGVTTLVPRAASGPIPAGTRTIEVEVLFDVETGSSDGYADALSLILTP